MLMQVVLVKLSCGEGIARGNLMLYFSLVLRSVVNPYGCYYNI